MRGTGTHVQRLEQRVRRIQPGSLDSRVVGGLRPGSKHLARGAAGAHFFLASDAGQPAGRLYAARPRLRSDTKRGEHRPQAGWRGGRTRYCSNSDCRCRGPKDCSAVVAGGPSSSCLGGSGRTRNPVLADTVALWAARGVLAAHASAVFQARGPRTSVPRSRCSFRRKASWGGLPCLPAGTPAGRRAAGSLPSPSTEIPAACARVPAPAGRAPPQ